MLKDMNAAITSLCKCNYQELLIIYKLSLRFTKNPKDISTLNNSKSILSN